MSDGRHFCSACELDVTPVGGSARMGDESLMVCPYCECRVGPQPSAKLTPEELKADVSRFIEDLSARTGVDIDLDEVWELLQDRIVDGG